MIRTILLYGDSNTWGANPAATGVHNQRFDAHIRWGGVLRDLLGEEYHVIEEGLNGRTTVWEDPIEPHRNGAAYLPACLLSHKPIDLVVIMLGTNDLKRRFNLSAYDIASGACRLVEMTVTSGTGVVYDDGGGITGFGSPRVLLICPAPIVEADDTPLSQAFMGGAATSRQMDAHFRAGLDTIRREAFGAYTLYYLNAGDIVESSPLDLVHLEAGEHRKLGEVVAGEISKIFA